ncbi:MAG: nucleotidyltransferase domain-containing protein [Candidatus Latescibacteria bacterium]|nr:nucleotidyltransferase domain-containing protein [Candidatus Latescibacterota bacterium]
MLNKIIPSRTRIEILKLLLLNPKNSYYQREIEQLINLPVRAVQREMKNLHQIDLVVTKVRGNRRYYSVNQNFPIYEELKSILLKTVAFGDVLREVLNQQHNHIKLAFIYGSYAQQTENIQSDIDLLVVGSVNPKHLSDILKRPKSNLHREINSVIYSVKEFKNKIDDHNHFLLSVLKGKKIYLVGNDAVLKTITQ